VNTTIPVKADEKTDGNMEKAIKGMVWSLFCYEIVS
jgi:hypothetical protein